MASKKTNEVVPEIDDDMLAAEERVEKAKEALRAAEEEYAEVKERSDGEGTNRETSFGVMLDGTLELVKKHPGLGIAAAAAVGFLVGRFLKRW